MPIRIYALAKELKIDSKELVEVCTKVGITGKGSALASLDDDEVTKIKSHFTGASAPAAPAPPTPVTSGGVRSGGPLAGGLAAALATQAWQPGRPPQPARQSAATTTSLQVEPRRRSLP